jgi:type IV pilus assembly protein PilC
MSGIDLKQIKRQQVHDQSGSQSPVWNLERILNTEIKLFTKGFSDKNKEAFYLDLSTLLTAGLDIKTSLELIESEQANPKHARLIAQLREDLINGASLWEAMKKTSEFTPYEYYSIQIGEETGKLDLVLSQLNGFYSAKLKQRRQFVSALSYPIIILLTSVGAVTFMLMFIVPMFSDVYKRFGGELPYLTRIIINFSTGIRENFVWIVLILGAVVGTILLNRDKAWMKKLSAGLISRIPVVGKIVYAIQLARFCNSASLLLGSKVPLIRSINLISQMITFYPIQITLDSIASGIMNGESLYAAMGKHPVFSKRLISLVKVGEEVNKLDIFFDKLSKQFQSEAEHQTSLLNTFLEPAMIIFLGTIVGFILLAMYLPMFELSTSIKG